MLSEINQIKPPQIRLNRQLDVKFYKSHLFGWEVARVGDDRFFIMADLCKTQLIDCRNNIDLRIALIQEIRNRPPLWDERDVNYRNKQVTCDLWNEVAQTIGCPVQVVKNKWNTLKDKYNYELCKEFTMGKNNPNYKSRWYFFDAMKFLDCSNQESGAYQFISVPEESCRAELCPSCQNTAGGQPSQRNNNMKNDECKSPDVQKQNQNIEVFVQNNPEKSKRNPSAVEKSLHRGFASKKENERGKKPPGPCYDDMDSHIFRSLSNNPEDDCKTPRGQVCNPAQAPGGTSRQSPCISNECKDEQNGNFQFLMSLLPYLDELSPVECLETRARLQYVVNEAIKNKQTCNTANNQPRTQKFC